ncbi:MAG TPA: NAD(P)H-dependent oxidoreductase [Xanthomonadales bacterium]|nr:NAD(P)H-dependent oxidoreductase [Xanthomonadales bacterium]
MKSLLQINASLHSGQGQSSLLASQFVENWQRSNPDGHVVVRDLAAQPVPHLTAERFQAFGTAPQNRSPEQEAFVADSDELIGELMAADLAVFGLPMYNFGIPSTLKAWIDHVARAGKTFRYTENGPVGLLADRPVYLFAARGGHYKGTPRDTQTAYMSHFLNFIGLRDIEFVYAEGLAMGDEVRSLSLDDAIQTIDRLAA